MFMWFKQAANRLMLHLRGARDRCPDLSFCLRLDNKTCCFDRLRAESALARLRDERTLWGG
jgi:hypothetical protein